MRTSMPARLRSTLAAGALALASLGACATIEDDAVEFADPAETTDDGKADQPDLAVTVLEAPAPTRADAVAVGVIKSKAAWKQVFGAAAPSSIDFGTQWVAYYTAGHQATGGFAATIARVRLSDTGRTLRITTRLDQPGAGCAVTQAATSPYAVVVFARPASAPGANRYTAETRTVACTEDACPDGTIELEDAYVDATDGKQCLAPITHCVTRDHGACPQLSPLPPGYCAEGTVAAGARRYVPSADGMECSMPSVHCLTTDLGACPQLSPLSPSYCADGTIVGGDRHYVGSADGMECALPSVHCLTTNPDACE